jgi:hypothetical protein
LFFQSLRENDIMGVRLRFLATNITGSMASILAVTIMQSITTCYGARRMSRPLAAFEGPVSLAFFFLRKRPREFFLMEARSLQRITADAFISGE